MSDLEKNLLDSMKELHDALENGDKLEDKFKVSRCRKVTDPKTGNTIYSRVEVSDGSNKAE